MRFKRRSGANETSVQQLDCADLPGVWRVDITLDQAGRTETEQITANQLLLPLSYNPVDTNSGHLSAVSKGPNQNWVFFDSETLTDDFNLVPTDWQAYEQEIIAINLKTAVNVLGCRSF